MLAGITYFIAHIIRWLCLNTSLIISVVVIWVMMFSVGALLFGLLNYAEKGKEYDRTHKF